MCDPSKKSEYLTGHTELTRFNSTNQILLIVGTQHDMKQVPLRVY